MPRRSALRFNHASPVPCYPVGSTKPLRRDKPLLELAQTDIGNTSGPKREETAAPSVYVVIYRGPHETRVIGVFAVRDVAEDALQKARQERGIMWRYNDHGGRFTIGEYPIQ